MLFSTFWLVSSFREIKREYYLKSQKYSKNNAQTQFLVPKFL